jgi:light-regulated signal transduction histidine kinase (bacteriophytochrome)
VNGTVPVDLTNCDREPIHIPGTIQPQGFLLASGPDMQDIVRFSGNFGEVSGLPLPEAGASLQSVLGDETVHSLRNALGVSAEPSRPGLIFGHKLTSGRAFDIAVHRYLGHVIMEFEPAGDGQRPLKLVRDLVDRVNRVENVDQLIAHASRLVAGLLGYDRVMIYRFEQDGAGKVISEAKRPDLESFLGQYFPASDIPKQARALYIRNTIRTITDVNFAPVPLLPSEAERAGPIDLSHAHLRSVSPIHCEYLRNMGVAASMSISILIDGELWGLIACHHYQPKRLSLPERTAAEMFGSFFSLKLQTLRQKRSLASTREARQSLDQFLRIAAHTEDVRELLKENLPKFIRLMPADGIGLWMDGRWSGSGDYPAQEAAVELARHLSREEKGRIWSSHALSRDMPGLERHLGRSAGVLAVPLSQVSSDYIMFFRNELVHTLNWAGNPDKSYGTGPNGDRLTPRKSFAIWKETVREQAQPWTDADLETADAIRAAIVEVVLRHSQLMSEERDKAEVRQRMLNEELNHRVKNILAIIKSLVAHSNREERPLSDYVDTLKGRLKALSFAHDQVVRSDGGGVLTELMEAELSPYRSPNAVIHVVGPRLLLDSRAFSVLALVLHELATNAAKYGALSQAAGKLEIAWRLTEAGDCEIDWRETASAPLATPSRKGFGTALIERSVTYDLGGQSSVKFTREGLRARLLVPARHVLSAPMPAGDLVVLSTPLESHGAGALSAVGSVLVVEDQMLIAMDLEAMLVEEGVSDVVVANSAGQALAQIRGRRIDFAVLDINLGQETSIPVAEELHRREVPFIFASGYGETPLIPLSLGPITVIPKPYEAEGLRAAIQAALRVRQI